MNPKVYRIECTIIRPVPCPHRSLITIKECLMLAFRSLRGYRYYYCLNQGEVCAYLFLKHNYLGKYAFMGKSDLLINPYGVLPNYRRQGYASALLRAAIEDAKRDNQTLYAVVTQNNTSSQAALVKAGFHKLGYVGTKDGLFGGSQLTTTNDQTELLLFGFGAEINGELLGDG